MGGRDGGMFVDPMTLQPREAGQVARRLRQVLTRKNRRPPPFHGSPISPLRSMHEALDRARLADQAALIVRGGGAVRSAVQHLRHRTVPCREPASRSVAERLGRILVREIINEMQTALDKYVVPDHDRPPHERRPMNARAPEQASNL